jgi:hypothetical protein
VGIVKFRDFIRYRIEAGKRGFLLRPADDWQVSFQPGGLLISHIDYRPFLAPGGSENFVAWSEIERVFAGQTDDFTWDTIWITFILKDGASCSVPETAKRWDQLLDQIPANLRTALRKESWLPQVMRTAFDSNITQLYPGPT